MSFLIHIKIILPMTESARCLIILNSWEKISEKKSNATLWQFVVIIHSIMISKTSKTLTRISKLWKIWKNILLLSRLKIVRALSFKTTNMAKLYATLETSRGKTISVSDDNEIIATVYDKNLKAYSVIISWGDIGDIIDNDGNELPENEKTKGAIVTTREWRNQPDNRRQKAQRKQ